MLLPTLILALGFVTQEPSNQLQRALVSEEADVRYAAALELAAGDQEAEKWLLRAAGNGTPEERRTLLLAAALMGTQSSFDLIEKAARKKGRKPDQERAYALVLYGSLHPAAGLDAKKDWARTASDFERGCLLAGLLSQPARLADPEWKKLVTKKKTPGLLEIYDLAAMLRGEVWPDTPESSAEIGARLLTTHIPGVEGVAIQSLEHFRKLEFPQLWSVGARHVPARELSDLKGQALVGDRIALVLSLYEVETKDRQELFDHFRTRVIGKREAAWLWGAAGELGLSLPTVPPTEKLEDAYVAGILSLACQDFSSATFATQPYLQQAREAFQSSSNFERRWPAAALMALGGKPVDQEILKAAFLIASGSERQRLQPIWKLASRSLGSERHSWLRSWSRDLGAGWIGFLDKEGPRWVAFQLAGGTVGAEGRLEIATSYPGLQLVPRDYAGDQVLYRDLAVLLLDGVYRWGLGK